MTTASTMQVEPSDAAIAAERELCRRSFASFVRRAWPYVDPSAYVHGRHIAMIAEHLHAMALGRLQPGRSQRLLVNVPPRHSKSTIVDILWPAWCWGPGGLPHLRFLFTSHREDLAERDSRTFRRLIKSAWYRRRWGESFDLVDDLVGRVNNTRGGHRIATSLSGITGEGGDFVVLDDPHSVEKAESDAIRTQVVELCDFSVSTRVNDPRAGGVVLIMQRLHESDYAGHLLEREGAQWDHLCLPARFEVDHPTPIRSSLGATDWRVTEGELLWPERWSDEALERLESSLGPYASAGQLQQRPSPKSGGLFQREWFESNLVFAADVPASLVRTARAWDLAASTSGTSDYTANVRMGVDSTGRVYVLDAEHFRAGPGDVRRRIRARIDGDGAKCWAVLPQDPGQAGLSQAVSLAQELRHARLRFVRPTGSKSTRAEPLAARLPLGTVKFVRGDWNSEFINELCGFPRAKHDDFVDAASDAFTEVAGRPIYASGQQFSRD
jgi:predicted phage terminase large subunit-like protein